MGTPFLTISIIQFSQVYIFETITPITLDNIQFFYLWGWFHTYCHQK